MTPLAPHLTSFLLERLKLHQQASPNTCDTYAYAFQLLLNFASKQLKVMPCVFRSIRSRIGIEVRSAVRICSINREPNFFYCFLTRFFVAFHYRVIFPH